MNTFAKTPSHSNHPILSHPIQSLIPHHVPISPPFPAILTSQHLTLGKRINNRTNRQTINQSINHQTTNRPTNRPTDRPTDQPTNQPTNKNNQLTQIFF
jgi:PT repeat